MTMKLPRKLLSCLLVLAICATTVFGCLMTVSAEETHGTYTIVGGDVSEDLTQATATVTFDISAGVSYGAFDVAEVGASDDLFGSVTAEVTGGTPISGEYSADDFNFEDENGEVKTAAVSTEDMQDGDLARVSFEINDTTKLYSSVTLTLTFTFANGTATTGVNYAVSINDFDFAGRYNSQIYTNLSGADGVIKTGCEHIITIDSDSALVDTDTVNGYSVYSNAVCSICLERFEYQVIPTADVTDDTTENVEYYDNQGPSATFVEYINSLPADGIGYSEDNPIIINTANELAVIAKNQISQDGTNVKISDTNFAGMYFKLADDIDVMVLQMESRVTSAGGLEKLKALSTPEKAKSYIEGLSSKSTWWSGESFAGHFDGNGVEIYGMYAKNALFPKVEQGATIKNVTVKNSYVETTGNGGVIVGTIGGGTSAGNVTVENSVIANCYVYRSAANDNKRAGVVCGYYSGNAGLIVKNVLTHNNTVVNYNTSSTLTTVLDCLFGSLQNIDPGDAEVTAGYDNQFSNSIFLDCASWSEGNQNPGKSGNFENVYINTPISDFKSDHDNDANYANKVFEISEEDITGLAAESVVTALNTANGGDTVWGCTANGYPTPLTAFADTVADTSNLSLDLEAVNLTYNNDGSFNLNFHYEPAYSGFAPEMYVAQADLSGFMKLEAKESSMANNGLSSNALMYVIENLSAREIGDTLLPTAVYVSGNTAFWGKTEQMSIADYAVAVINGEAVYTEGASNEVKQQDKNVAAAVINYGNAAKAALEQDYDGTAYGTVEIWGDAKSTLTGEDTSHVTDDTAEPNWYDNTFESLDPNNTENSETNPYIIDSAEGLAWLATKATAAETSGKWYKVADGIKAFNMNTKVDMSGDMTPAEVEAALNTEPQMKTWWAGNFAGNFDGNGVTIYGVQGDNTTYAGSGSLFNTVAADATFKNFTLKNSFFKGDKAASLFGDATSDTGTITVENVVLTGNAIICTRSNGAEAYGGVMFARAGNNRVDVKNCLVYNNSAKHQGYYEDTKTGNTKTGYDVTYGLMGRSSKVDSVASRIENSIILDCLPYTAQYGNASTSEMVFSNVYTNMIDVEVVNTMKEGSTDADSYTTTYTGGIISQTDGSYKALVTLVNRDNGGATQDYSKNHAAGSFYAVTADNIKGSAAVTNMPNLDWSTWAYGMSGEYPTPITSAVASDEKVISCYSGTPAPAFSDTAHDGSSAANAIIISSADELAYLANGADGNTANKYYEIDPTIDAIVLQPEDYADAIMALDSASAVKNYFENKAPSGAKKEWATSATNTTHFDGTLNGNGVTIYGMYSTTYNVTGLFPHASDITLENIAIKNCYVKSDKAGVIVGYATTEGTITLNNCEVANNVSIATRFNDGMMYGGVLIGRANASTNTFLTVDNCVIYGNIATHTESSTNDGVTATYDTNYGLYGIVRGTSDDSAAAKISNSIILDTLPFSHNSIASNAFNNGTFSNVYTNMLGQTYVNTNYNNGVKTYIFSSTVNDDGTVVISSGGESTKNRTLAAGSLISISAADVLGDNAKTKAPELGWVDKGGVWYTGNAWGYPSFEKAGIMPAANQLAFDSLTMTNYDVYTATDPDFSMYATSLNLKTNPYIAFTFAFNKDYKANRQNITVTFTNYKGDVIDTTTVADENGNLNAGWTNNTNAGRYHLYRLTDVPVEDLCKPITVTVKYGEKDAVEFGKFSVEGFALDLENAYKQDPCQYYATRVEAAKALLFYTQMVNARYSGQ